MPPERTRTAASSRTAKPVRVWGELGVTVAITEQPPQFVKVLFGHERIAPDGSADTLARVTAQIDEYNEEVVQRQLEKYKRLILAVEAEEEAPKAPARRGARRH